MLHRVFENSYHILAIGFIWNSIIFEITTEVAQFSKLDKLELNLTYSPVGETL